MRRIFAHIQPSRYQKVAAFGLCGAMVGALVVYQLLPSVATAPVSEEVVASVASTSEPVRLLIPKINVDAPFVAPLGINSQNGEIEVPDQYDAVGWYKYGPVPGELGPAVVLGHVDSVAGPAVFWSLGQLAVGDRIFIEQANGDTTVFSVTKLQRVEQTAFPMADVYGDIDHAGIRLITCTGTYDRSVARYSHNLIVYGEMVTE